MSRRAASITQADVARVIRAAKQAGASEIEIRIDDRDAVIIRVTPSTGLNYNSAIESADGPTGVCRSDRRKILWEHLSSADDRRELCAE